MPNEAIEVSDVIPATPQRVFEAWLDSAEHSAMTGSEASVEGRSVGASFKAGNGYVWGTCLELEPNRRIVQSLRSLDFPSQAADSRVEVLLEPAEAGTRITVRHTDIPEGQAEGYRKGWVESYFGRMKTYFGAAAPEAAPPAPLPAVEKAPAPARQAKPPAKKRPAAKKKPAAKKPKAKKRVAAKRAPARRPAAKAGKRKAKMARPKKRPTKRSKRRA